MLFRSQHGAQPAAVTLALDRGVHTLRLEYTQLAGAMLVQWDWAAEGEPLHAVEPWRLSPRKADFWLFASSAAAQVSYAWGKWLWLALALFSCATLVGRRVRAAVPALRAAGVWPALPLIIGASLVLNGVALWWGLPVGYWPPDELTPKDVAVALAQRFSHGWFERYPPFQFYVLALINLPVWLMEQATMLAPGSLAGETLRAVLGRLVSLAASEIGRAHV